MTGRVVSRRLRLADLYAAEWIKLWSLRSTWVTLALAILLGLYLAVTNSLHGTMFPPGVKSPDRAAFDGPSWVLLMLGMGMIGAQSLVGEHTSGLIRTTLLAVPARRRIAVAKALVIASVTAAVALVVAVGGLALAHGVHLGHSAAGGVDVPRAIAASSLLLPVCALAGMALGALLRHPAVTGFAVCTALGFGPLLLRPDGNRWATAVANSMPYYSWGRLAAPGTGSGSGSGGTMTVGTAWLTLAVWAAASIAVTVVVLNRRDV